MSSITYTLPKEYAFVAGVALLTSFLNLWQGHVVVGNRRKLAKVPYPNTYADAAHAKENPKAALMFNCAQRAHLNTLEHLPTVLVSLMWAGLRYPITSAALGGAWIIGRVLYTTGYATGEPKSRHRGGFHTVAELGLYFVGLYASYEMYAGKW